MEKKVSKQNGTPSIKEYSEILITLKTQIQDIQIKAVLAAHKELIKLYWHIGKTITEKQNNSDWGSSIIERLANDLQKEFPGISGFSRRNIFRMQAFYKAYQKVPQAVAQLENLEIFNIPWGHNAIILEKLKDTQTRLWYAQKTIEFRKN